MNSSCRPLLLILNASPPTLTKFDVLRFLWANIHKIDKRGKALSNRHSIFYSGNFKRVNVHRVLLTSSSICKTNLHRFYNKEAFSVIHRKGFL